MLVGAAIVLASVLVVNQAESGKTVTLGKEMKAEAAAD